MTPFRNTRAWPVEAKAIGATVRVKRTQITLVCVAASTLHVLQGCMCDPGLIFHWKFPRRLDTDLRWLSTYVALSRVRGLQSLKSVGLSAQIRAIIEQGPPDTIPEAFARYFEDKEVETQLEADKAMAALGWS